MISARAHVRLPLSSPAPPPLCSKPNNHSNMLRANMTKLASNAAAGKGVPGPMSNPDIASHTLTHESKTLNQNP